MRFLAATTASLIIAGTKALASTGATETGGMGLLATFFIAFVVMVILFQFLPGMTLFLGIMKGIFSSEGGTRGEEAAKGTRTTP